MGQFSVEKPDLPGSVLSGNQQSPAKAIDALRVEGARNLMEQSRHPIDVVARQTGSATATTCGGRSSAPSDNRRRSFGVTRGWMQSTFGTKHKQSAGPWHKSPSI
jgi:hypothetical protein